MKKNIILYLFYLIHLLNYSQVELLKLPSVFYQPLAQIKPVYGQYGREVTLLGMDKDGIITSQWDKHARQWKCWSYFLNDTYFGLSL